MGEANYHKFMMSDDYTLKVIFDLSAVERATVFFGQLIFWGDRRRHQVWRRAGIATRDAGGFTGCGATLINPWDGH